MSAIVCDRVSFAFGTVRVLNGISFELERGGYLSIIGPNGSAKSTLLKCILGLHDAGRMTGSVTVEGLDVAMCDRRRLAKVAAYVPQAGGHVPPFTVREFAVLSRYPYARRQSALAGDDLDAVSRALSLTDTARLAEKPLAELSGGERQRAYLAAALAQGANLLFLDEPTSFLDPRNAAAVNTLLKRLNREEGYTVVTVTHDLNHPLDAGGHVLAIRHGEQTYFGPVRALTESDVLERTFSHGFSVLSRPIGGGPVIVPDREA